jgi:hypothetical protein
MSFQKVAGTYTPDMPANRREDIKEASLDCCASLLPKVICS